MSLTVYDLSLPQIPLTYARIINGTPVSGLSVTVQVTNASTFALLLSPTACPETATGSGVYSYKWTHGLVKDTEAFVTYSYQGYKKNELILLTSSAQGSAR